MKDILIKLLELMLNAKSAEHCELLDMQVPRWEAVDPDHNVYNHLYEVLRVLKGE